MTTKIAKILTLIHTGLLTFLALFSGIENGSGIQGVIANLPNAAPWLLAWGGVFIAWKNTKIGGGLFLVLAIISIFFFHTYQEIIPFLIISLPLAVIGVLFLIKPKQ